VTDRVVDGAAPVPGLRLVESYDGWLLTITPQGVAALLAGRDGGRGRTSVLVEVHPNLVPGEPFSAEVRVSELTPEPT
jgi:hypothetical protein